METIYKLCVVLFLYLYHPLPSFCRTAVQRSSATPPEENGSNTRNDCEAKYASLKPTHTRCLQDAPQATESNLSTTEKQEIVLLHNRLRAQVDPPAADMQKMIWDENLAITARKWAMQCILNHDVNRLEPDYPGVMVGQNLAAGHSSFQAAIDRWYNEKTRRNYMHGKGYKVGAGHFFQMVSWEASRIGCGEASCPHTGYKVFRVCNYAVRLDASKVPYQSGIPCSECPEHCDSGGKLCDCGAKLCFHGGTLNITACQCQCVWGWTGDQCQEKFHCDLRCLNGGTPDLKACKCRCGLFSGKMCETCPKREARGCGKTFITQAKCWTPIWRGYMLPNCPYLCGLCSVQ